MIGTERKSALPFQQTFGLAALMLGDKGIAASSSRRRLATTSSSPARAARMCVQSSMQFLSSCDGSRV